MELVGDTMMMAGHGKTAWAETAFERVFFEYYGRIVAVLYRVVGDRARAEELASDTFLRLYQQPQGEERYENLGGWLYRTATRLGIDSLRSSRRRARCEQVAGPDLAGAPDDPLDEVLRAERRTQVRAALARLKPFHAQILTLRSSGMSYQEVADALGVKVTSVGRRLARAEAAFEKAWSRQRSNHVH